MSETIRLSTLLGQATRIAAELTARRVPLPPLGSRAVRRDVEVPHGLFGRVRTESRTVYEQVVSEGWPLGLSAPSRRKGSTTWADYALLQPNGMLALARRDIAAPAESELLSRRAVEVLRVAQYLGEPRWVPVLPDDPGQEMMARFDDLRPAAEGAMIVLERLRALVNSGG